MEARWDGDLHSVLVPEHQELGLLGRLMPGQHHQAVEQAARYSSR